MIKSALQTLLTLVITSVIFAGCESGNPPVPIRQFDETLSGSSTPGSNNPDASASEVIQSYRTARAVRILFNKRSFYTNQNPNAFGCGGDAKSFYDALSDVEIPIKPDWLKNVGVELTNSNALYGPSLATACALSGLGAAEASNCAGFDDLQPLSGANSRSILVGGYGCANGNFQCVPVHVLSDIWNQYVPETTADTLWAGQKGSLPVINNAPDGVGGVAWHAGDYDELHDQFYVFGGATPTDEKSNFTQTYTNAVSRLSFNPDLSLSGAPAPTLIDTLERRFYTAWAKTGYNAALAAEYPAPALVGSSFTYSLRREPSLKSMCLKDANFGTWSCLSSTLSANSAVSVNEHQDYFLLAGGLRTDGFFETRFFAFKPHAHAPDTGSYLVPGTVEGDWALLSNIDGNASFSNEVMSISDLSEDTASASQPFAITAVNDVRPDGETFLGWLGRGYHQTAYDPDMNRFYIFGGIQNQGVELGAALSAIANTPELTDPAIWIYDPPALGRRPTAACKTTKTPDNVTLPATTSIFSSTKNLGVHENYLSSSYVFPPGGCLQRILLEEAPTERFSHAMAFNRDEKLLVVFGGCTKPAAIPASGSAKAGYPLANCSSNALLDDTWLYIPPTVNEIMPNSSTSSLIPNILGTNFWTRFLPLYPFNDVSLSQASLPTSLQAIGKWIQLSTVNSPTPRAGASFAFDRAHQKFYLQGGYGCTEGSCASPPRALNDLWELELKDIDAVSGTYTANWVLIRANKSDSNNIQPTQRMGAIMSYAQPQFSYGDGFYTVTDSACINQGPINTMDPSVSKKYVGSIYVDLDRSRFSSNENLLINLTLLPFDSNTKLPGLFDNGTPLIVADDTDTANSTDTAIIRIQLLNSPLSQTEQVQSSIQPRYHEYISGTPIIGDSIMHIGGTGQLTTKQILVPLKNFPTVDMIKIERVQGSYKIFEMSLMKI